jgi:hypothetical protein
MQENTSSAENLAPVVTRTLDLAPQLAELGYLDFLAQLVIDSLPEPRPFREVGFSWQVEDAETLAPPLEQITGHRPWESYQGPKNFWFVRARGHNKTSSIAWLLSWALGFSRRHLHLLAAAADQDQAKLITDAMTRVAELNPWLAERVKVSAYAAKGRFGELQVVTSDAPSAFGSRTNIFVLDEITWWKKQDLWMPLWSGRQKRPGSLFIILSNAGMKNTWQWDILQAAKADPKHWWVWDEPRRLATWMDEEAIQHDRKLLPAPMAKRLIDNVWIDPGEESGYLSRAEVLACEAEGLARNLTRRERGEPGLDYALIIDYGPKRDRTALAVLHQDPESREVIVDQLDVWQGSPEQPVQVTAVDAWIEARVKPFFNPRIILDKYELEGLAQKWEHRLPVDRWEPRGGKANYEMAELLRDLIVNRRLLWYPNAGTLVTPTGLETLADELAALVTVPTSYGYRFDHELNKHDDRAVVLGMGAVILLHKPLPGRFSAPKATLSPPEAPPLVQEVRTLRQRQPRMLLGVEV